MVTNLNDSELTALGQLEAELAVARATIDRVRELHFMVWYEENQEPPECGECMREQWPCQTIRALDGPSTEGEEQSQ